MKLFVIYIGGSHEKSLIELHDMRFAVADTIEETYEDLRKSWWGIPDSLHIDAWGSLQFIDGYELQLSKLPPKEGEKKLFFVNLGGYDKNEFAELHKNVFIVAENFNEAKIQALSLADKEWNYRHRDYYYDVDNIINVDTALSNKQFHIHLVPAKYNKPFEFTCKYLPIGRK